MDLWFGDSWPIGEELGQDTDVIDKTIFPNAVVGFGRDNPLKAFSTLVSNHRKQNFINFSKSGASIDFTVFNLINSYSEIPTPQYQPIKEKIQTEQQHTAFLCVTAQIRGFGIEYPVWSKLHYNTDKRKTVDRTEIYDSIIAINCFYSICKNYNIDCVIIPIFCDLIIPEEFKHLVLFNSAILSKTSLVELTFGQKLIDDNLYNQGVSEIEIYDHLKNKDWIAPNRMHPNLLGHRKLAYKLIELLENR
jgi:hypothetical protein